LVFSLWLSFSSSFLFADWHSASENIMGTRISVELWHEDPVQAKQAIAAVMASMRTVDQAMSPYIESSELYRINQQAAVEPVEVSASLFSLLQKSLYYSRISEGAFDISFSSLGKFYDYRQGVAPKQKTIDDYLPAINYQLIELNSDLRTVHFKHPHLHIDLGGIAKGYAVDMAINLLFQAGISSAIVSAGGDSRILGDRRSDPWVIGIRHPRKADSYVVRIPLVNTAISTSGDYERFFIDKGERVHHIINPHTGKSVDQVQSVSVLAPLAVDSDALSTTVFVLGVRKGLALVNKMTGIDAIIIDAAGQLHYSEELLRAGK
jgi:thiamine biosynthesis lipoprotein